MSMIGVVQKGLGYRRSKRSMLLLISIVMFFILAPILENARFGGLFLILTLYITLVTATTELAKNRTLFLCAIPIAIASMTLLLASHLHPTWPWLFANSLVLTIFLMLVSASLFIYLGQKPHLSED